MQKHAPSSSSSNNKDDEGGNDNDKDAHVYKRYKLSEEKTFNTLFFREKETLLKLVDHFASKSGKYSISGFPHKLGLLLHVSDFYM